MLKRSFACGACEEKEGGVSKHKYGKLSPPALSLGLPGAALRALRSQNWAPGHSCKRLEREIKKRLDVDCEVILTTRATVALEALWVCTERPEHTICPLTWPGTYSYALGHCVEVDDGNGARSLPLKYFEWRDLGEETSLHVELYGVDTPAGWNPHTIDAAHNFLGADHGRRVALGQHIVYSFGPQKQLPSPCGGALVTTNRQLAAAVRRYLDYGVEGRICVARGAAGLMPDFTAELLLAQFKAYNGWQSLRQERLEWYESELGGLLLTKPGVASGHLAIMDCGDPETREMVRKNFNRGPQVAWSHHYPLNEEQRAACPKAAALSDRIITLPLHTELRRSDVRAVCYRIRSAV